MFMYYDQMTICTPWRPSDTLVGRSTSMHVLSLYCWHRNSLLVNADKGSRYIGSENTPGQFLGDARAYFTARLLSILPAQQL